MIYNYINGKIIIAKMYDEFNIKSRDWENRTPKWIADALKHLNIFASWREVNPSINFSNHSFELPKDVIVLRGIKINGIKGTKTTTISHLSDSSKFKEYTNNLYNYSINGNTVHTEMESGTAEIIYKCMPLEWDDILGMWIPKVPDLPLILDNIGWYVLRLILSRGYSHPIYSLTTNNPELNPYRLWKTGIQAAKLSAKRMTNEDRANVANIMSSMLVNPFSSSGDLFSNTKEIFAPIGDFLNYWERLSTIKSSDSMLHAEEPSPQWIGEGDRLTGVHGGTLNEMSVSDDFLYICVVAGDPGQAVWKRVPLKNI